MLEQLLGAEVIVEQMGHVAGSGLIVGWGIQCPLSGQAVGIGMAVARSVVHAEGKVLNL